MLESNSPLQKKSKLTLEQLQETMPRTPYDKATWLQDYCNQNLKEDIIKVAEKQRNYISKHKYDLEKFGLSESRIREDCKDIYQTFLNEE